MRMKDPGGKGRRLGKDGSVMQSLKVETHEVETMDRFVKWFKQETKQSISKSFLWREGARQLMAKLKHQLKLVKDGSFHAKKRNDKL